MNTMRLRNLLLTGLLAMPAVAFASATDEPGSEKALSALRHTVRNSSHPRALETAFDAYFAFKARQQGRVAKPYLYYVDYGLPSTEPRGYVFDMEKLTVVDGPFTVAHGRGSAERSGVPVRFSNAHKSYATSLGLYTARGTYTFGGKASGRPYTSLGLKLEGESGSFNDNAMSRGVVAHGAPYVTATRSGRSQGCPAMEQARAKRLLPMLANGGVVFLFAPDADWMSRDPWITAAAE